MGEIDWDEALDKAAERVSLRKKITDFLGPAMVFAAPFLFFFWAIVVLVVGYGFLRFLIGVATQ